MAHDSLEIDFLRYDTLPSRVEHTTLTGAYRLATLSAGASGLAPLYTVTDGEGQVRGRIVVPSGLASVELYILGCLLSAAAGAGRA